MASLLQLLAFAILYADYVHSIPLSLKEGIILRQKRGADPMPSNNIIVDIIGAKKKREVDTQRKDIIIQDMDDMRKKLRAGIVIDDIDTMRKKRMAGTGTVDVVVLKKNSKTNPRKGNIIITDDIDLRRKKRNKLEPKHRFVIEDSIGGFRKKRNLPKDQISVIDIIGNVKKRSPGYFWNGAPKK